MRGWYGFYFPEKLGEWALIWKLVFRLISEKLWGSVHVVANRTGPKTTWMTKHKMNDIILTNK